MDFIGTGRRLAADDFARAAKVVGCQEAAIRAVVAVEARGTGWDTRNRPVILFEPHVFYRNLAGAERDEAVRQGLAYKSWKPGNYPNTSDGRYAQLDRAMKINAEAALEACSWGICQVLGENHLSLGFSTARAMVERCLESEGGQLDVMVAFVVANHLDDDLRRLDWAGFARGYNGPAYAKNAYDVKLASAYRKALASKPLVYDALADGMLSIGDKGEEVRALQTALADRGYYKFTIDTDFGQFTNEAVHAYQAASKLLVDGKVGKNTGQRLGLTYWG